MADKELAAKLARRLQAQNETDEEPRPMTSEPPPAPVIPQKIVSNPHVATDNSVNIDDLILNTLIEKESNNNGTTASISPLVSPKSLDSNGNVSQSPLSPPPKTTIRNLIERDYQNNPACTQAAPSRPLVGIVHHKKEERPATPTRQKTPEDGSELERKLEAQRRKKVAVNEESDLASKKEEAIINEIPGPVSDSAQAPTPETEETTSVLPDAPSIALEVVPKSSENVPKPSESTPASETIPETPIPRPRKSSFEELEELFEQEAKEESDRLKEMETPVEKPEEKMDAVTQDIEPVSTATQVSETTALAFQEPETAVTEKQETEIVTKETQSSETADSETHNSKSANRVTQEPKTVVPVTQDPETVTTIIQSSEIIDPATQESETNAPQTSDDTVVQNTETATVAAENPEIGNIVHNAELPEPLENQSETTTAQSTEIKPKDLEMPVEATAVVDASDSPIVITESRLTTPVVEEKNDETEPILESSRNTTMQENPQTPENSVENQLDETVSKPSTVKVKDPEGKSPSENKHEVTAEITDQDLDNVIQKALLASEKPIVKPVAVLSSPSINKPSVPSPLLIEAIRIECGGLKSPPPLPPPKPQTPTHSRPQSPAIFKKAPVSLAMSSTSTEGLISCISTDKKSVDVDSCDELSELLERRQKIMEGDEVPERINRKLSLYAEFSEFSRKQIKFFTETFQKYDEDRDGFIDFNELKRMMEKLGEAQTHIALKQIIQKVDEDKDGKISIREFLLLFRLAAEGHFGCSEVFTQLAGSVDVSKEGVLGAASFFQAKIAEQTKLSKFEEEIKQEQDERKKEEEERKQRREKFLQNKSIFH